MNKIVQFLLCNTLFIFNTKSECTNCNYTYEPVCASNGFTYGSLCEFECLNGGNTNVTIVRTGECPSSCIKKRRPGIWSPYAIAHLKHNFYDCAENERCLKVIHASKSTVNCFCLEPNAPVCGSDQKDYENSCIFYCVSKKKNITAAYKGICRSDSENEITTIRTNGVNKIFNCSTFKKILSICLWIILRLSQIQH